MKTDAVDLKKKINSLFICKCVWINLCTEVQDPLHQMLQDREKNTAACPTDRLGQGWKKITSNLLYIIVQEAGQLNV